MSQFPDTKSTQITERVMREIREVIPVLPTSQYNSIYSSVWAILNEYGMNVPREKSAIEM